MSFFSGIGVAMTKDPATLMVGQYFKRKRELMEIVLTSATGLGLASVAAFILFSVGWVYWIKCCKFFPKYFLDIDHTHKENSFGFVTKNNKINNDNQGIDSILWVTYVPFSFIKEKVYVCDQWYSIKK